MLFGHCMMMSSLTSAFFDMWIEPKKWFEVSAENFDMWQSLTIEAF